MNNIIQFKEANCKNCYKCIRSCEVKSIAFESEQAQILEKDCILCGHCFLVCPQNAKYINSSIDTVKGYLKNGERVYASVAPSYVGSFKGATFQKISAALKKLGFTGVEETAIGAGQVTANFGRLMQERKMKNIITTCCSTVVLLIEKYYPELLSYLAPVASPMLAHGRMMKEVYGKRIKTVFIGPCISKIYEAGDVTGQSSINAVLMFDELNHWFEEEEVDLSEIDVDAREIKATINRLYPVPGGIIKAIPKEQRQQYKCISVDGIDRCKEVLTSLQNDDISDFLIEMSACPGSCLGGPGLQERKIPFMVAKDGVLRNLVSHSKNPKPLTEDVALDLHKTYLDRSVSAATPTDAQIEQVFQKMGKNSEDKILNCGGCGYPTCRDKAIAVLRGKADIKMCLPFMREKAESISNIVMDNTPNAIILMDDEYCLMEYNAMAGEMFGLGKVNYVGKPISMIIDCDDMDEVKKTGHNIFDRKVHYTDFDIVVKQSTIYVAENGMFMLLIKDITAEEQASEKISAMREETVEVAQEVINKQMRVAQEIASLLGETTAETKLALTNLKKYIQESEDERIY